ncbi:MAG: hypothetical protein PHQ75_15285 [Thermoguttaceae bacterium]|nr:hypothetical protein [Thermoguttaceae bacterium]
MPKQTQPKKLCARHAISEGLFFVLAGLVLFFFLVRPCFQTADSPIRFMYMLLPILEPGAIFEHFWGSDLVPFSFATLGFALWQRMQTLFWALVCLAAATGLGLILPRPALMNAKRDCTSSTAIGANRLESFFLASVSGFALWSGLFCWLGILGWARLSLGITLVTCGLAFLAIGRLIQSLRSTWRQNNPVEKNVQTSAGLTDHHTELFGRLGTVLLVLILIAFVLLYLLGAMIPTCEYDMLEYHLQSAREFYESGRIAFAPHNIYMNMPLGTEMFHLWGMNLTGNVFTGALVGKTLIALSGILASLGVALVVHRVTDSVKYALFALVVYLSFPINFDVFSNGLNDGVLGMVMIAIILLLLPAKGEPDRKIFPFSTGLLVGMAVACKYTGIVFVLFPVLVFAVVVAYRKKIERKFAVVSLFLLGFLFVCGGWYFKNCFATGNPFHPLAFTFLGDTSGTWDAARNLRWTRAHSPSGFTLSTLLDSLSLFSWNSVTASPFFVLTLLTGLLAVPRLIGCFCHATNSSGDDSDAIAGLSAKSLPDRSYSSCETGKTIVVLTGVCLYYLVLWWTVTHRIERFLVPIVPVIACLFVLFCYVIFSDSKSSRVWRSGWLLLFALWYPLAFSPMLQTNYLLPYQVLKRDVARFGDWSVWFNDHPEVRKDPPGKTLLLIGQAQAFSYDGEILYNTCWDVSPLRSVLEGNVRYDQNRENILEITRPEAIREKLTNRGIGWIVFDEGEWRRFRQSGNYGLTEPAINGRLLRLLVAANVLEPYEPEESDDFMSYTKQNMSVFRLLSKK